MPCSSAKRHASTSTATQDESIEREIVHVDGDLRRVLLRQREELVAELPCRAPVHRTDHLDVDVTRVTGDGTGEHRRLRHVEAPWPMRFPTPGARVRAGQRRAGADSLTVSRQSGAACDPRHRAVLNCVPWTAPTPPSACRGPPTTTTAAGRTWRRPGADVHGEAALVADARAAARSGASTPGAAPAGGDRARPPGLRDGRGRRRPGTARPGPRPRRPSSTWVLGDLATAPGRPPPGPVRRRAVLAGNVMIFVAPGTEADVLAVRRRPPRARRAADRGLPAHRSPPPRRATTTRPRAPTSSRSPGSPRGTADRSSTAATTW